MTQDQTIKRALAILAKRIRHGDALASPSAVRDYLRLLLHDRGHEVFVCVFLDSQNRVLACDELFRGTLAQTRVYPREVVKAALGAQRRCRDLSGKDTTSRWHPPLRTGREGFPSSGSSRWEARRRNRTGQTQRRRWGMGPPTGLPGHRSAVSKVRPPSRIIGISLSPDLQVPPDHGFVGTDQRQPVPLTLWGPNPGVGREAPASSTDRVPVTIQHPIGALTFDACVEPSAKDDARAQSPPCGTCG